MTADQHVRRKRLWQLISQNNRRTYREYADTLGVGVATINLDIRALESEGYIQKPTGAARAIRVLVPFAEVR